MTENVRFLTTTVAHSNQRGQHSLY